MLTRQDIQYDLLEYIFTDQTKAFTDQRPGNASKKICFKDLYIGALFQSSKCSKVLKDKMKETPAFAAELGKISLLANVGRINTTMAFFPEMRTALRTYHPVPSLQKTDGNLQDAPRIKNCLKAALLPSERDLPPTSLAAVLEKLRTGVKPPTSIVNLIFIMANQTTLLARTHFDPPLDFLDLFMPGNNIPSSSRARAFLWLVYHYLEDPTSSPSGGPSTNPFADEYSEKNPGKVPLLPRLSPEEMRGENIDPPEEIEWGNKMCALRTSFLQRLVRTSEIERRNRSEFTSSQVLELAPPNTRRPRAPRQIYTSVDTESGFRHYAPQPSPEQESSRSVRRHSPYPRPPSENVPKHPQPRQRTMFEHAFHIVSTSDPLADSDEDDDENVHVDYERRLHVLRRLRGKSPTPPRFSPRLQPIEGPERPESGRTRYHPYPGHQRIRRRQSANGSIEHHNVPTD
ncbi:uncharacterized protein FOMMEDRAFT_161538 [Fomitiporia mediterranea MF3/22]|uniref:uncharacterized protein n=1 Tax=Fomitiporia mediterranea (strain MF3/22) TaxID=694068 RepID=UPI00044079F5|nr:uncharacterized protein FOMMEDRAFT_161538 [Fomitiporia mediterranea MF3/22]EJC98709.1 hypothetical protein FOMMEDRAFT_161538 [Fomitiporia mediterranea MF3/22]